MSIVCDLSEMIHTSDASSFQRLAFLKNLCPVNCLNVMAGPVPSPCFARLADIWNHLALRGDVDDIILELLGRFSLERVDASTGDKSKYQHVLLTLLVQLDTIFYLQRLTLPSQQVQIGPHLGYLVSWEVAARTVELVLQTLVENREALWDAAVVRDEYLSEFLLGALRILALHPRQPSNQRSREKRRRLGRIHRLLEQIFDAYPGPKSFLLTVCKEVTSKLHEDPDSLSLPQRMRHELPNLAGKLVSSLAHIVFLFFFSCSARHVTNHSIFSCLVSIAAMSTTTLHFGASAARGVSSQLASPILGLEGRFPFHSRRINTICSKFRDPEYTIARHLGNFAKRSLECTGQYAHPDSSVKGRDDCDFRHYLSSRSMGHSGPLRNRRKRHRREFSGH